MSGENVELNNVVNNGEEHIINKNPGKPGLDETEGKYRILGAITVKQVFKRKGSGTNIAPAVGYLVEEVETGRRIMLEKSQGVQLCAHYGMQNAYIVYQMKTNKSQDGEVLKQTPSVYLQPFPAIKEAFTQDDRLVMAFKMSPDGSLLKPLELTIKEEQCTPELWRIIQKEYDKVEKRKKRSRRGTEDEHRKLMENLKSALNTNAHVRNPFEDR